MFAPFLQYFMLALITVSLYIGTNLTAASVNALDFEPFQEMKIGQERELNIIFTGDIMLGRHIAVLEERYGDNYPFRGVEGITTYAEETFLDGEKVDFWAGNLEGPITEVKIPSSKEISFRFKPEVADILLNNNFQLVNLANNHMIDQGWQGFESTKEFLDDKGIMYTGHPSEESKANYKEFKYDGVKIGILGFNHTDFRLNEPAALKLINKYDSKVNHLIVTIHWGIEYQPTASNFQTRIAHTFVDNGADMVWGHHPHVEQNHEIYNNKPIYYSLGNFVFDQFWSTPTQKGLTVLVTFAKDGIKTYEIPVDLREGEPYLAEMATSIELST